MNARVPELEQRLPTLDALRGAAILLVLMHQLLVYDTGAVGTASRRLAYLMDIGWVGVTLFFVLSGFLITHLLLGLQGHPGSLCSFYVRRALRIVPLCYLLVLGTLVLWPGLGAPPEPYASDRAVWYLLFLSNWAELFHASGKALPSLWSLAVEEQFYLLWPLLVAQRSARQVLLLSLGVALAGIASRALMVALSVAPEAVYVSTFSRMDALAAGASLAAAIRLPGALPWLVARRRPLAGLAAGVAIAGLLLTHGYPRLKPLGQSVGYTLHTLVFTLCLAASLAGDLSGAVRRGLARRVLTSFGRYSYAIYLFHHPLHMLAGPSAREALERTGLGGMPLALSYVVLGTAVLWCAGWLSARLVEQPLLALRPGYAAAGGGASR
jgi:peptidoglycan/LPS O-acetylase OafA/YrhL